MYVQPRLQWKRQFVINSSPVLLPVESSSRMVAGIIGDRANLKAGRLAQLVFQKARFTINPALADFHDIGRLAVGQPSLDHIRPVEFIFPKQPGQLLGKLPTANFNIVARVFLGQSNIGVEGNQQYCQNGRTRTDLFKFE
jgi:hypothetical protein